MFIPEFENFNISDVFTPVNITQLHELLIETKYNEKETHFIINGFANGFPLGYAGSRSMCRWSPNLKLECSSREDLWEKVMKGVRLKHFGRAI